MHLYLFDFCYLLCHNRVNFDHLMLFALFPDFLFMPLCSTGKSQRTPMEILLEIFAIIAIDFLLLLMIAELRPMVRPNLDWFRELK